MIPKKPLQLVPNSCSRSVMLGFEAEAAGATATWNDELAQLDLVDAGTAPTTQALIRNEPFFADSGILRSAAPLMLDFLARASSDSVVPVRGIESPADAAASVAR